MTEANPFRPLRAVPQGRAPDVAGSIDGAVRRAGRGDGSAFGELYDLTSRLVFGVVVQVVRDPAMAEEVAQEVYLELWRLAPRFDPGRGSARAWIAAIAHRRAVDRVRAEQARRDRDRRDAERTVRPFDEVAERVTDDLDRTRLQRALGTLSRPQWEAVRLAYYGGMTYREVAVLLQVPEGTVKTRIRDGLIKLRDHLGVTS